MHQNSAKHLKVNDSRSILVQVGEIHKPYGQIFVGLVWHQHRKYRQYTDSFRRQCGGFRHNRAPEPKSRIAVQPRALANAVKRGSHFCAEFECPQRCNYRSCRSRQNNAGRLPASTDRIAGRQRSRARDGQQRLRKRARHHDFAKNTAIKYRDTQINIVDTPGHADFGGEVERILSMVDAVLLLVDAVDGPMPQTRFVTQKAFAYGLKPIVVVNKIDRPGADPDRAIDQVFELFDNLGGSDEQLDFSSVYASAINGVAGLELDAIADDMSPLLDMIVDQVPPPEVDDTGLFQMQISSLDYSTYEGVIGIGRITRGVVERNQQVIVLDRDGAERKGKVMNIYRHSGLSGLKRLLPVLVTLSA